MANPPLPQTAAAEILRSPGDLLPSYSSPILAHSETEQSWQGIGKLGTFSYPNCSENVSTPLEDFSGGLSREQKLYNYADPCCSKDVTVGCDTFDFGLTSVKACQTEKILSSNTPRKRKLEDEIMALKTENKRLRKDSQSAEFFVSKCYEFFPKEFAGMLETHIRNRNKPLKGRRFKDEVKTTSLTLNYLSPNSYKHIRENLCTLPSVCTLRKFTQPWPSCPGNMEFNLRAMQLKYQNVSGISKYCVLCVDEMSLKSHLFYNRNKGEIVGVEDNGKVRSNKVARNAFVIMVRGIAENWKVPLDYIFTSSCCPPFEVKKIVFMAIRRLREIGFEPVALVSDMGTNFQALSSILGISTENTSFEVDGKPLHFFFDSPHLLKLVKNNLMKSDIIFDGNKRASFEDVRKFFQLDSLTEFKLAHKLTNAHISPNNFQKMSVKLSAQVLSHSVAADVYTLVAGNKFSATGIYTAEFIEKMDKLFDIFNSSTARCPKEMRRPFRGSEAQMQLLNDARSFITSFKLINGEGKDVTNSVKFIKGWLINIQSLLDLWKLLKDKGFTFLLMRRINQDSLENFFGSIRKQGGNCHHPTPLQFSQAFKKLWGLKFLELSKSGNCEYEKEFEGNLDTFQKRSVPTVCENSLPRNLSLVPQCPSNIPSDYRQLDYAEENAITYVAGYLFKKCQDWHRCATVHENESGEYTVFTDFKEYSNGNLVIPPKEFVDYIKRLENRLNSCFQQSFHYRLFDSYIFESLSKESEFKCCEGLDNIKLLWLFIRLRIYFKLKFYNRTLRNPDTRRKLVSVCNL